MMKKKMMVFLMAMAMTAGLMTGCGSSDSSADAGDKGSAKTEAKSEKKDDDDMVHPGNRCIEGGSREAGSRSHSGGYGNEPGDISYSG